LALPSSIGGLQTGCATDGKAIFTNGVDIPGWVWRRLHPSHRRPGRLSQPGYHREFWRHERPRLAKVGGAKGTPAFTDVGDPVGSGIALANGVVYFTTTVSNKLVALDAATGKLLNEIYLGPVWSGPVVSRGRVYVGTGNMLFSVGTPYFARSNVGAVISFGCPARTK